MNLLGRRSLSSFFKVLLDVAFYAVCLFGAVSVVVAIVASRTNRTNISLDLPVRFGIDPSTYRLHGASGTAVDASIDDTNGFMTIRHPPAISVVLTVVGVIVVEIAILVVLYRLRQITCFYGEIDPATGRLTYVNAGHNPPYLCDGDGRRTLDPTAVVLGMIDGMPFAEAATELRAGSRLLLYTDGVTEAENKTGDQFGPERLEVAIDAPERSEPASVLDAIMATVARFRGTARQSDDITMMLVSRDVES